MGFLLGGHAQANQVAAVSGLQVQSSVQGKCVPILYGTTRIAGNLIWYGDFTATPQSSPGAGKGGVGGGGGGKGGGATQYSYSTSFEMALCEGPISKVGPVYIDKNTTFLGSLGMSLFLGEYGQQPWGYLVTKAVPITETHTIPGSGPFTVTVGQAAQFAQDDGATTTAVTFTRVAGAPATHQYSFQLLSGGIGLYTFNAAQAGQNVQITSVSAGSSRTTNTTIPVAPPYQVQVPGDIYYSDGGVKGTGTTLTEVSGTPGVGQYNVSQGVYTFNAAQAGSTVVISYFTMAALGQALGYSGYAYVAAAAYQLGNSAQLPNHNFEVHGNVDFLLTTNGLDADPSLVIPDFLSNPNYGCGFPADRIGDLSIYQAYTLACGLWISPAYSDQAAASSSLDDLATATNSAFVWSSGLLTLVPYGDETVTGNGHTYTPPSTPLFDLTDDDFLPNTNISAGAGTNTTDPVLLTRLRPSDALNSIKVEALDRTNAYNPAVVEAKDEALIEAFGLRTASSQSLHMFCDLNAARLSAQLQLQRQMIRNTYQFSLDQRYVLLDPMDIVTITDSYLGLNKQWVRITEITENDDRSLSIVAEEYLQGTGHAPAYSFEIGAGFGADYNSSAGNVNDPVIFEPPAELSEALEVWLAVSGGLTAVIPGDWGGCQVWTSNDGTNYRQQGTIHGPCRTGVLVSSLATVTPAATGQTIDTSNTVEVDLSESAGQLASGSQSDALALNTLCYAGGELIAYQNADLVGNSEYALSYLVRGAYGSTIGAHAAGGKFTRIDDGIFKIPFTQDYIGSTVYVKLLSFNRYGGALQSLADVSPYSYILQGTALSTPLPPITSLRTSYIANITQLTWDEVTDFRPVMYEIRQGAAWKGAQVLGRVAHPPFAVQGNGTYWVSAVSQPVAGLTVYSESPVDIVVAGAQIVSNVIATHDEEATGWSGTLGGTAAVLGSDVVTSGAGNILTDPDFLGTPDLFAYGGEGPGTYTIPTGHIINVGRVAPCSVIISWTAQGQHTFDNILSLSDFLNQPDILDNEASENIDVYPEIALSQDGVTWGAWQKYAPGSYNAMAFNARMQLETFDPTVIAILSAMVFEVDVPDRDDHYVNVSIAPGGTAITFTPDGSSTPTPFNGGPQGSPTLPHVQVTILNASSGDTAIISSVSLSGCTVQVKNGASGVARDVNVLVQGF